MFNWQNDKKKINPSSNKKKKKNNKKNPIKEIEISPELRDPSPELPDLPKGSCPTCNI